MLPECLSAVRAASIKQSANEMPGAPLFTGISEGVDSGFLRQNTSLARLAVLNVLSAARRLVFWQSRAIAASFTKILRWLALPYYSYCQRLAALSFGKVEPLYFGCLKYGCPEPRVFRASPNGMLCSPLFIKVPEVPARKRPIYAGLRAYSFAYSITTKHPTPP